ncbi:MAG: acetyltransferase [Aggregatilineales bacterium]
MSEKVVIFGTGDFAQVASVYLQEDSPYEVVAFTVNQDYLNDTDLLGLPVVPFETLTETHPPSDYKMLVAVGFSKLNQARAAVYQQCKDLGYTCISHVDSRATLRGDIEIGENVFIFEENVIQPFVTIGDNVVIWSGNHIGHHSSIGSHCFIASHAVISGKVGISDYCFIGVNATIIDSVQVAESNIIGAGALITRDTQPEELYPGKKTLPSSRKSTEIDF